MRQMQTMRMLERLAEESPYHTVRKFAKNTLAKQRLPIMAVLNKIPGKTHTDKAKLVGVSRQTYYAWVNGVARPNRKRAKKLSTITGFDADAIHGAYDDETSEQRSEL
jgi:DNA-binding XRE family transcriptional regulator